MDRSQQLLPIKNQSRSRQSSVTNCYHVQKAFDKFFNTSSEFVTTSNGKATTSNASTSCWEREDVRNIRANTPCSDRITGWVFLVDRSLEMLKRLGWWQTSLSWWNTVCFLKYWEFPKYCLELWQILLVDMPMISPGCILGFLSSSS